MKNIISRLIATFFALSIFSSQAVAQERTAIKQGFELAPNSDKKILVFRPFVSVNSQSTGGMIEPNAEWTEEAKNNIAVALAELQAGLGNQVIEAPEAYGESAQNLQEHMALFSAVSQSVINYQFFVGNRLPTKKRDNKTDVFEWSLGKGVADLPGASEADYGLFLYNKDAYGSTGRKLFQIAAMLTVGAGVTSGEHHGFAGLVDLKTGDLLWLNADFAMGGDVRKPEGAQKRVGQLLEEFPGSEPILEEEK